MSINTTSGSRASASSTASRPSAACPTTSSLPSCSRTATSDSAYKVSSSTTRTCGVTLVAFPRSGLRPGRQAEDRNLAGSAAESLVRGSPSMDRAAYPRRGRRIPGAKRHISVSTHRHPRRTTVAAVSPIARPAGLAPPDAAFAELYERHASRVFGFCLKWLRSREEAEDAAQTTFFYAWRGLGRGVEPRFESAWLLAIARNVCRSRTDAARRRAGEIAHDPNVLE